MLEQLVFELLLVNELVVEWKFVRRTWGDALLGGFRVVSLQ